MLKKSRQRMTDRGCNAVEIHTEQQNSSYPETMQVLSLICIHCDKPQCSSSKQPADGIIPNIPNLVKCAGSGPTRVTWCTNHYEIWQRRACHSTCLVCWLSHYSVKECEHGIPKIPNLGRVEILPVLQGLSFCTISSCYVYHPNIHSKYHHGG